MRNLRFRNGTVTEQRDWLIGVFARPDWLRIKPFECHGTITEQRDWLIGVFARPDWLRIKPFECHRTA